MKYLVILTDGAADRPSDELGGKTALQVADMPFTNSLAAKGEVGTYDNMTVIKVPKSRMPDGVNFIIAHRNAATAPVKMSETKIHQDPPGISGALLEGREYYDCFVFNAKKNGVYCDKNTSST